jgi:hypothetical protein
MALRNLQQYGCQTGNELKEKSRDLNRNSSRNKNETMFGRGYGFNKLKNNMRQVQPETLPKNSNFSSCLQNIKLKNNTT